MIFLHSVIFSYYLQRFLFFFKPSIRTWLVAYHMVDVVSAKGEGGGVGGMWVIRIEMTVSPWMSEKTRSILL